MIGAELKKSPRIIRASTARITITKVYLVINAFI